MGINAPLQKQSVVVCFIEMIRLGALFCFPGMDSDC